jgi:FAD:protein FMN transferase
MTMQKMNRRSFLKLPAFLPFVLHGGAPPAGEHHFQYERVLGTSMDLIVWTPRSRDAESACRTVLEEIDRLASILDTRNPASEISLLETAAGRAPSLELKEVFDAYDYWERRTGGVISIRPDGRDGPRNVDALGKAYIIDRAAKTVRITHPSIEALLLNIGGDIVTWGRRGQISVADPASWYDNADPVTTIDLADAAVATSGTYARGSHLKDARNGQALETSAAATVVASDAVTANALATMLCLTGCAYGFPIVESTPRAHALRVAGGIATRTLGFARLERPLPVQTPAETAWPPGYQLTLTIPLTAGRSSKRPYVAAWVEDSSGKLVRVLTVWGSKSKYYPDLTTAWNFLKSSQNQFKSVTRATRSPGRYDVVWQGLDNNNKPVPPGTYRITVETNQEHGTYARQSGTIVIGDSPATITLPATANFDTVTIQYGPKP